MVRGRKDRDQMSEIRCQKGKARDGGRGSDIGCQRSEGKGQRAKGGGQKSDVGSLRSEIGDQIWKQSG